MKKICKIIFLVVFLISICGCNKKEKLEETSGNEIKEGATSLVIYFSETGKTESIATSIANLSNSSLTEIVPKVKYTTADLDYNNKKSRSYKEQHDNKSRPQIANDFDIDRYDTIYLGYPIWYETVPQIIYTLLDNYNLEGKTIIPFCTSDSSSIEKSINDLKKYNPSLTILDGKRFEDNNEKEILNFISKNIKEKIN